MDNLQRYLKLLDKREKFNRSTHSYEKELFAADGKDRSELLLPWHKAELKRRDLALSVATAYQRLTADERQHANENWEKMNPEGTALKKAQIQKV